MKTIHVLLIVSILALFAIAGGYATCSCPNGGINMKWELDQLLRVKRWEVVTNVFWSTPMDGLYAVYTKPMLATNYVTNAIIGTARKDLFRSQSID